MGGFLIGTDPTLRKTKTPTVTTLTAGVGFTAGTSTAITLGADPTVEANVIVTMDGVTQHRSTYSVSGTTLTFDAAIPTGTAEIEATFVVPDVTTLATPANDSVATAKIADNAVTLGKLAGGTDGNIISYDASGDPVAIATGTSGHFLKSQGAGAQPVFAAAGGAWTFIGTTVASASASLTLTGIDSTYDTYAIAWSDLKNATDNVNLYFRVGDSGGIDTGAADYQFGCLYNLANSTGQASSIGGDENIDEAFIMLSSDYQGGMNLQATGTCGGLMYLHSPADAEGYPLMTWTFQQNTTNNDATWSVGGVGHGNRKGQITTSQVQFYMSSGNITSGRATIWGISHA